MVEHMSNNINPPYEMKHLDSENVTIIQAETVELVEQKRLGTSTIEIDIKDIIGVEKLPSDEGDMLILRRKRGNPMRIGPLNSVVATNGSNLLKQLIGN